MNNSIDLPYKKHLALSQDMITSYEATWAGDAGLQPSSGGKSGGESDEIRRRAVFG